MLPPRVICIIRHSEREDHINHKWSSSRPHDSPLSSGGEKWAELAGAFVAKLLCRIPPELLGVNSGSSSSSSSSQEQQQLEQAAGIVNKTVCLSSPLTRTVQTGHFFVSAFENVLLGAADQKKQQQGQQQQQQRIDIHAEESLLEPAFWMTHDLQRAGYGHRNVYDKDQPVRLDLLAATSPRFIPARAGGPLRKVQFCSDPETGGFVELEKCGDRFRFAARKLLRLSIDDEKDEENAVENPLTHDKIAVMVGHGASTVAMYNAIRELSGEGDRRALECSPFYTGFCMLLRVSDDSSRLPTYVNIVPPFARPPHLQNIIGESDDGFQEEFEKFFSDAIVALMANVKKAQQKRPDFE